MSDPLAASIEDAASQNPADPTPPPFVPARPPRFWRLRRFLRSLNPIPLFFGPVFQREIRVTGRRRGTYVIRLLVLAVPTAIVALIFASTTWSTRYGAEQSVAAKIQSLQMLAFYVAMTVAWCQLITLTMVAPLLTAGTLVEERVARTLSAIAVSPLTAGSVVGGLFASRVVNLVILALLPLPLLLAIRTFGGLDTSFVVWSLAVAICGAVAPAAVGLWASARTSRTAAAVSSAVGVIALQWSFPLLLFLFESALTLFTKPGSIDGVAVSPPAVLAALMAGDASVGVVGLSPQELAALNCAISLGIAAVALAAARWQLARLIATDRVELVRQPTRRQRKRAKAAQAGGPALAGSLTVGDGDHSRTVTGNPVLWREMRQPLFQAGWKRWFGLCTLVVVVLGIHAATLSVSSGFGAEPLVIMPAVVSIILLLLSAAAVPAGAVTTEREAQTWATLLTTPLSPMAILLPKVAGAARRLWPAYLFITLHLIFCSLRGLISPMAIPFTLLHFAAYSFFLCSTGVFFSLRCRKSAAAATINLMMVLGLWMLAPIFFGILMSVMGSMGPRDSGPFFFSNPVVTFVGGLVGFSEHGGGFDMPGTGRISAAGFLGLWLASLAFYVGLAAGVLALAKAAFHQLSTARL